MSSLTRQRGHRSANRHPLLAPTKGALKPKPAPSLTETEGALGARYLYPSAVREQTVLIPASSRFELIRNHNHLP